MQFLVEKEPTQETIQQVVAIAQDYTQDYFTANVPDDTKSDLLFQRVAYLKMEEVIVSFIVFTCLDGFPHITLLATKREYSGKGYGKILMQHFVSYVSEMGFSDIEVMTVWPEAKPVYFNTLRFYESVGFSVVGTYPYLWESGAIKLKKSW